ncbi:MAG: class C sortase [Acutalibacteraceae bacterium]
MKRKGFKDRLITVLLILGLLAGLSIMLYPTISEYYNSFHQSKAIADYSDSVAQMTIDQYEKILDSAKKYNENIKRWSAPYIMTEKEMENYNKQLNISHDGIMGYVEIPSIDCSLPLYHGTEEAVLQIGLGHLEWSSLPVGGKSTHCVISGHRGLPSATLFTNLDKVKMGDIFMIRVLDEVFTYEVDQILTVDPNETNSLRITEGEDYCTLVTCTPYGINTERIFVRGHRIPNQKSADTVIVTPDGVRFEPFIVSVCVAAPLLFVLLIIFLLSSPPKEKSKAKKKSKPNKNTPKHLKE